MDFKQSTLQLLLNEEEFFTLKEIVSSNARANPDIQGVLITGSLVQNLGLPSPPQVLDLNPLSRAYADIVGRTRRKLFPHLDSDFDFWVLTREQQGNEGLQDRVAASGANLLEWYANQPGKVNLAEWIQMKKRAFDSIYKKPFLYSPEWNAKNKVPSEATSFKQSIEKDITVKMPELASKVEYYFKKKIPGEFIEVRSFPSSVFNLKTERIPIGDYEDRTPFPFYIRDWVDLDRNCIILYGQDSEDLIYPFNSEGYVPGANLAKQIDWTPRHIDHVLYRSGKEVDSEPFKRL